MKKQVTKMSTTRKVYFLRLIGRCIVFILTVLLYVLCPTEFEIIYGVNFFERFSVLHLLWAIWILDMILQLFPIKAHISIGSQKQFPSLFKPIKEKINYSNLKKYITDTAASAKKVMILWMILIFVILLLHITEIISTEIVFLFSVCFYVCDLICVLIWCPFRLMLGTRCCTTCRIYNWDHMMMFTPMMFIISWYCTSLLLLALAIFTVWEACVMIYPERFWEKSNEALKCSECTDKLCTQYCRKLR